MKTATVPTLTPRHYVDLLQQAVEQGLRDNPEPTVEDLQDLTDYWLGLLVASGYDVVWGASKETENG